MVEGYESEADRHRRLEREREQANAEEEAACAKRARAATALAQQTLRELRSRLKPNCMVEVLEHKKKFWSGTVETQTQRRVPGWYLGRVATGYSGGRGSDSGPPALAYTHYVLGEDGDIYWSRNGVGSRREFRVFVTDARFSSRMIGHARVEGCADVADLIKAAGGETRPPS